MLNLQNLLSAARNAGSWSAGPVICCCWLSQSNMLLAVMKPAVHLLLGHRDIGICSHAAAAVAAAHQPAPGGAARPGATHAALQPAPYRVPPWHPSAAAAESTTIYTMSSCPWLRSSGSSTTKSQHQQHGNLLTCIRSTTASRAAASLASLSGHSGQQIAAAELSEQSVLRGVCCGVLWCVDTQPKWPACTGAHAHVTAGLQRQ